MNTLGHIDLTILFVDVNDFCNVFIPAWLQSLLPDEKSQRMRESTMHPSEVMTILILFHSSGFRSLKNFYLYYVSSALGKAFPKLVSYNRFVELEKSVLIPLTAYLNTRRVTSRGIAFVDSTKLQVCHNRRIPNHKTFKEFAARGKTSVDWFYGFKLHIIIDDQGELVYFLLTPGNIDDRKALRKIVKELKGKLFGDKSYISAELKETLWKQGVQLITTVRKNMKEVFLENFDKILLRKRFLIETVIGQLKNICQLEHTRHRSLINFMVNVICALVAYSWKTKKPSLNLRDWKGKDVNLLFMEENNIFFLPTF
ncbi:transposase [Gammaproteobacteria bacterium]